MVRVCSVVQRSLTTVVESVTGHIIMEKDVHHNILSVVACHVQRSTSKCIDCIWLLGGGGGSGKKEVDKEGGRREEGKEMETRVIQS